MYIQHLTQEKLLNKSGHNNPKVSLDDSHSLTGVEQKTFLGLLHED